MVDDWHDVFEALALRRSLLTMPRDFEIGTAPRYGGLAFFHSTIRGAVRVT